MPEKAPDKVETKQAVVTSEQTKTTPAQHWKVPGFRGGYKGIGFDDDGVSDRPVPVGTMKELTEQFPILNPEPVVVHSFAGKEKATNCDTCGRTREHSLHHVSS